MISTLLSKLPMWVLKLLKPIWKTFRNAEFTLNQLSNLLKESKQTIINLIEELKERDLLLQVSANVYCLRNLQVMVLEKKLLI